MNFPPDLGQVLVAVEEPGLVAVEAPEDGLAAAPRALGVAGLGHEPRLHIVEEAEVVELDLAQLQEVPAELGPRRRVEVHGDGPDRRLDDDRHDHYLE